MLAQLQSMCSHHGLGDIKEPWHDPRDDVVGGRFEFE